MSCEHSVCVCVRGVVLARTFAAGIGAVSLSTLGTNVPLTSVTGRARGHYDYVFFKIGSSSTSSSSSSSSSSLE